MRKACSLLFLLFIVFTGISRALSDTPEISIHPNPNQGSFILKIKSNRADQVHAKILAITGKQLSETSFGIVPGDQQFSLTIQDTAAGIYFLALSFVSGFESTHKIVMTKTSARSGLIDIIHYNLDLSVRNLVNKTIEGTAQLSIQSRINNLDSFTLDLLKLNVSKVTVDGIEQAFTQNDSVLFIRLSSPEQQDDTFDITVSYGGHPVTDASWGGFYFSGDYAYNMGVAFTSEPHNFGRCWFPCVDNFTDRATYSFHITTDPGFKAVCNGLKQTDTVHPDGSTTWNWELAQPIPTYLASVAVGKYEFIKYDFQGINRTYPVWLAMEAKDTLHARQSFAKLKDALQCFEQKFGAYPFDRVGYVAVPFNSGAMEHATNISYPIYAIDGTTNFETLFAHELSHMWWGDLATCRTAEDMWLNEGWASFSEALFLECVYGKEAYINDIRNKLTAVLKNAPSDDGGYYPVSGIPAAITYGTHVYKKGALVAHSLRTIMGDTAFFAACRSYLAKHPFKDVSSEDLKIEFQKFTPADLINFFNRWVYEKGNTDVVITSFYSGMNGTDAYMRLKLQQFQRFKTGISKELPVTVTAYDSSGKALSYHILLNKEVLDTTIVFNHHIGVAKYVTVNEDLGLGLGKTMAKQVIKSSGTLSFPDVLASINVQQVTDSVILIMEHHWTAPTQGNLRAKGIRISPERYWKVDGILPATFKAWAFLNYDGTTGKYLDNELITQAEDSLVLLYRPDPDSEWEIHTDHTFQPGSSNTDKTGRFWVNNLQKGEYTFGMRDITVVGIREPTSKASGNSFSIIPNPVNGQFLAVKLENQTFIYKMTLTTITGKQVDSILLNQSLNHYEWDLNNLKPGAYHLTIVTPAGAVSRLFLKE